MVAYSAGMAFIAISTVGNSQTYISPQCLIADMARTLDAPVAMSNRSEIANTMSADGRLARDVMLGLLKTCRKLGLSFFAYLGDRLGLNPGHPKIPPLADLVIQSA